MRISDWSSDVCSSDLAALHLVGAVTQVAVAGVGVGPGVHDADHRLAHELLAREAHLLHARAVAEGAVAVRPEPAEAAEFVRLSAALAHGWPPVVRCPKLSTHGVARKRRPAAARAANSDRRAGPRG